MDDVLIERWKDGDPMARVAVRNNVRGIAERVLGHPGLHRAIGLSSGSVLMSEEQRREITVTIAEEVLQRGAPGASQLTAIALIVAGRRAVEELQAGRPVSEENHTPPQALVTFSLAGKSMAPRVRQAVEKHLEACAACREDVRILGNIVRNQEAVGDTVDKERVSAEFDREAREAAPDVGPVLAAQIKEVSAQASAEVAKEAIERLQAAPKRPRRRVHRDRPETAGRNPLVAMFPVLALAAVMGGVWWLAKGRPAQLVASSKQLASVAVREAPSVRDPASLGLEGQIAAKALSEGDCVTAAGRFRTAKRDAPDEPRLHFLEGVSWVCAGQGQRALVSFDELEESGAELPRGLSWYRAQAHLLAGDGLAAIEYLTQAQLEDPKHRDQASSQVRQIQAFR